MKLAALLSVFWVSCLLGGVQSRPIWDNKLDFLENRLRTLDLARNRELFLSALQSYFSNRGVSVDRTAPAFLLFPPKSWQTRTDALLESEMPGEGTDLSE